jgi:RNase H-fold protein (predicted Holliday junction resolvase)
VVQTDSAVQQEVFSSYRVPSSSELVTPRQIQRLVIGGPQMMQGTDGQCRNKHVRKKLRNSHSYEGGTPTPAEGSNGFSNVMAC